VHGVLRTDVLRQVPPL